MLSHAGPVSASLWSVRQRSSYYSCIWSDSSPHRSQMWQSQVTGHMSHLIRLLLKKQITATGHSLTRPFSGLKGHFYRPRPEKMEETPLPTKRAERKALKAPKLCSSDLVRRNLNHLFDTMSERPCFDYFDRLQAQVKPLPVPDQAHATSALQLETCFTA